MDADQIIAIDKHRMAGASAGDVLESLIKAFGQKQGAEMFQVYAQTPMPDGRKRSQVNFGDPEEWL